MQKALAIKLIWDDCYKCMTAYNSPQYIEWVKDDSANIEAYVNRHIPKVQQNNKHKIALLLEGGDLLQNIKEFLLINHNLFDYVFTFDKELLKNTPNSKPIIWGGIYSTSDKQKVKNVSFCVSNKTMPSCHIDRSKLADRIKDNVDVMGTHVGKYVSTEQIYGDYRFSIVCENEINDIYFSEKLCNAFSNKCIPINYGCTDLVKFGFDTNGIIQVNSYKQIEDLVKSNLDWEKEYNIRKSAIEHNYEIVKKYKCFEDHFYLQYKDLLESLNVIK